MIIYNNNQNNDMKLYEKVLYKLKLSLFGIIQKTMNSNIISKTIFKCLIVLETLQITYFVINPKYNFLWESPLLEVIQGLLQYVQISTYLDQKSNTFFLLFLYTSFGLVLISTGLSLVAQATNQYKSVSLQILSVYSIFLITILGMPMMNSFFSGIICFQENNNIHEMDCFSGQTWIHFCAGIIGVILLAIQLFIYNTLLIDLDPFSDYPIASLPSSIPWVKTILKIVLPLISLLDRELTNGKELNLVWLLFFLVIVIMRIRIPAFYQRDTLNTIVLCEGMLLWVTICACLQGYVEKTGEETDIMNITYFIIGIPLFNFAMVSALLKKRESQILEEDPNQFYKPDQIRVYINVFIKYVEESLLDKKIRLKLLGLLKVHQLKCMMNECPCNNMSPKQIKKDTILENRRQWYIILKYIILMYLEKNPKCCDLLLLSSYIHFGRLNLKYKSLKDLMKLEELRPDFQVAYNMFNHKYVIEDDIILNDGRSNKSGSININQIVLFQNQFVIFKDSIEDSQIQHCDFWTELQEPKIDIQKVSILGEMIQKSVQKSKKDYNSLMKLNSDNRMSMEIYANYMRQIVNNEEQAEILLEKLNYMDKVKTQQSKSQTSKSSSKKVKQENKNTCVVTLSLNLRQFGIVTNTNYDLMRMFGYKRKEVVGTSISMLMPKAIGEQHDSILLNFIEKSDKVDLSKSRQVMAVNKDGFCCPIDLIVKVLPNLDEGLQLVGFLNEIKPYHCPPYINENFDERYTSHYIIYDKKSLLISSCTYSCYQFFGIPKALINGNSSAANNFTIDLICPDINNEDVQYKLQNEGSVIIDLDTTIICQNFILSQESNKNLDNQKQNEQEDGEANIYQNNNNNNNKTVDQSKIEQNLNDVTNEPPKTPNEINPNQSNEFKQQMIKNLVGKNSSQDKNDVNFYNSFNQDEDININQEFDDYLAVQYKRTQIQIYLEANTANQCVLRFEDLNEPERLDVNDEDNYENIDFFQKSARDQLKNQLISKNQMQDGQIEEENQLLNSNNQEEEDYKQYLKDDEQQIQSSHRQQGNSTSVGKSSKNNSKKNGSKHTSLAETSSLNQKSMEQRYIKDLQMVFSDKTQSVTIQILKKLSFILYIIFISILTYQFTQKIQLRDNLTNSIQAIFIANNRHTVMPDSNFFARQIFLDANDYYLYENDQLKQYHKEETQQQLQVKVKELHEIQFQVLDQIEIIKQFYSKPIELSSFKLKFLMPNGNMFEDDYSVTDGMLLMVAAASSIADANLDALIEQEIQIEYNTDQRYFFYIMENGMTDLRYGSEIFSVELQKIYIEYVDSFQGPNTQMLIINLVAVISFTSIIIPLIFKVQKQNNEVLSIFALIPIEDIQYFVQQCKSFENTYLVERTLEQIEKDKQAEQKQLEEKQQIQEDKINNQFKQLNKEIIEKQNQDILVKNQNQILNTSQFPDNKANLSTFQGSPEQPFMQQNGDLIEMEDLNITKNDPKSLNISKKPNKNVEKPQIQNTENADEELEQTQSNKLINSNKNEQKTTLFNFSIITLTLIIYFIIDNILESSFLTDVKQCIEHTQMMAARPSHVKFTLLFAMEEIIRGDQMWYDGNEMLEQYANKIYKNEKNVENSYQADFPSSFNDYKDLFDQYNYADICEHSEWQKLYEESRAQKGDRAYNYPEQCKVLQGGILNKGLGQSIKTIYENIRTFITQWREEIKRGITKPLKQKFLSSQEFKELIELQDFLLPTLYYLLDTFTEAYQQYIQFSILVQQITFFSVLFVISLFTIFLWVPFMVKMSQVSKRIKGMLNMLPISLILKNQNLKNAFKQDGILKYYK